MNEAKNKKSEHILEIKNLSVSVEGKSVVRGERIRQINIAQCHCGSPFLYD